MKIVEALLVEPGRIELSEKEVPALSGDDVLVSVVSCGVCTSELPVYRGEVHGVPGVSFRYAEYPCYLGHEISGTVVDTGPEVKSLKPGDRVTGVAYRGSGFATHVVDSEKVFVMVPEGIPIEHALGEPLMAVTNIVRMSEPDFGDFVFIVGDGFMSLLAVSVLARYPLKALVVAGHHNNRLALAKEFGATHTVNTKTKDPYWVTRRLVDGPSHNPGVTPWPGGVDIAFDFAGKMSTLKLCASLCKPKRRARLMMPSFYGQEPFAIGHYLMNRAPSLVVCHPAHSRDVMDDLRRAMWALEEGIFPIGRLITHAFGLEEVETAMETAQARSDGYIKGIVVPDFSKLESESPYTIAGCEKGRIIGE